MEVKKVGIWIRVSTGIQVERDSHIHHEDRANEYVKRREWKLAKTYRLEGMSGKSVMGYSETKRMLADIRSGAITGLVFWKISRLARNTKELIEISEIFNEYNADLISMDMTIDTSTSIGRHFFRQMASMAEWQREVIVENINASVKTRARLGKTLGGQAPYGFTYINQRLEPNEDEAPIVRLIFDLFIECKRKNTVAKTINEQGYRTRKGNKFSDSTITRILTNTVAKGIHVLNKRSSKNPHSLKPKEEWIFHQITPIVTTEVWDAKEEIIQSFRKNRKPKLNTKVHIFTGFVYCHCGSKMRTQSRIKSYYCKKECGNKIYREDLEEIFRNELHSYTVSEDEVNAYFAKMKSIEADQEKQLASLERKKMELEKQIEKLLELHVAGKIATESFDTYHAKPYEQLCQVKESIESLKLDTMEEVFSNKFVVNILDKANNLYSRWNTLTRLQKRDVIENTTEKIIVGKDSIEINLYKILPDFISFENAPNGQRTNKGSYLPLK